jgi:FKBP-type peptidyl-prolyl cis-trans isomerase SlyD
MANKVITFHYTLSDSSGRMLDSSEGQEPLAFIEGIGQIIPALEEAIKDMKPGEKKRVEIPADKAYGAYDEEQVITVPRSQMPQQEIQLGDQFMTDEDPHLMPLTVTEITDENVTMDANHPLAGVDLVFDIEMVGSRQATEEEMEHGHVHGEGGHHH